MAMLNSGGYGLTPTDDGVVLVIPQSCLNADEKVRQHRF